MTLDEAKKLAAETVEDAIESLKIFGGEADFLRELVKTLVKRTH